MISAIADLATRRPRAIVACALILGVIAGALGASASGAMTNAREDFFDPRSESLSAAERLGAAEGASPEADVVALVRTGGDARPPGARARVPAVARRLAEDPAVAEVLTRYEGGEGAAAMVSEDGRSTVVLARFRPGADENDAARRLLGGFAHDRGVTLGGPAIVAYQALETAEEDLRRAELLAFPILFVCLILVFRGLVAALLPLLVGGLAVAGASLGLRVVAEMAHISVFALNVVTGLGLGLAIDYSLLVVSRYREEIARRGPGRRALERTLQTAGRTVLVSSVTVAAALAALLVFPLAFLRSMAVGGVLVALLSAAVSLAVLPALLALLGNRVNAPSAGRRDRAPEGEAQADPAGRWYRLARGVMRRPGAVAAAASALLVALALPVGGIELTSVGADMLPDGASAHRVDAALERDFPGGGAAPVYLAVAVPPGADARAAGGRLADYAAKIAGLPGVAGVSPPRPAGGAAWRIDVVPAAPEPFAESTRALVTDIRALDPPYPVEVGGQTAEYLDQQATLAEGVPLALAIVFVTTFVLLFFATGSFVIPLKSLVMNGLTVAAAFGALVWIYQAGRLDGVLGYEGGGALENTQPIVVLVLAFGLGTDYSVILLTRIKEARDGGADDREAVAVGLARTGRIVTAAALLFCVAVGSFATSGLVFVQQLGIGAALAVLIDATVVRALLVPALMALLGRANWWAPVRPSGRFFGAWFGRRRILAPGAERTDGADKGHEYVDVTIKMPAGLSDGELERIGEHVGETLPNLARTAYRSGHAVVVVPSARQEEGEP